jgi:hypothetical protein
MKKIALLTGLCISALVLSACSNQKRVVGSKGDQYTVNKDVQKVGNDSEEKEYEPYTITLNLERTGAGQNTDIFFHYQVEKSK